MEKVDAKERQKRKLTDLEIGLKEQNTKFHAAKYFKDKSFRLLSITIILGPVIIFLLLTFPLTLRFFEQNSSLYHYAGYIWYILYGVILARAVEFLIYWNKERLIKNSLRIIQEEIEKLAPIIEQ